MKRIKYAKLQRMFAKNRKRAYDDQYNNNSISNSLDSNTVFEYCKHLLTHTSISHPNSTSLHSNLPVEFVKELLIYPEEVTRCNPKGKSSAGPDGLSV